MIKTDWCECKHCKFPAIGEYMKQVISSSGACPMCSRNTCLEDIVMLSANRADSIQNAHGRYKDDRDSRGVGGLAA
jgi:hypothetical protein